MILNRFSLKRSRSATNQPSSACLPTLLGDRGLDGLVNRFVGGFVWILTRRRHQLKISDDFVESGVGADSWIDRASVRVKSSHLILEVKRVKMSRLHES